MQTIRFSAALAAALALMVGFAASSRGQVPGGAPASAPGDPHQRAAAPSAAGGQGIHGMGVVDVKYIFANYPKFEQQMNSIKQRVEAAEADARRDQEALRQMTEKMKGFEPGKPEFRQLESDYVRKQGDLQLKVATQKRQFLEEEGRIYFNTGREIDDAVKVLAARFNLVIVFRVMVDEPNPNNRNEIMMGLSKNIVYSHPQMDITPFVLQELQRGGPVSGNLQPNNMVPQPRR